MATKKGEPAKNKNGHIQNGIWKRADGDGYLVDISVTDPETGKFIRRRKTMNRLDTAVEWRDKLREDARKGLIRGGRQKKKNLFQEFADEYFGVWKGSCKDSTVHSERNRINGVLKPYFGGQPIQTIVRKDIETFLRKRKDGSLVDVVAQGRRNNRKKGISEATANRDLCRIKNMFKKAVEWGYLKENPALGIPQSKERIEAADYLDDDEVQEFLDNAEDEYRPIFLVAVYTGLRYGEIMNLAWQDVDFRWNRGTVRDPKNSETRYVPMHQAVRETLEKRSRKEEGNEELVFVNPDTGRPYNDIRKAMRRALDKAGVSRHIRFHDLRHTTGSHLAMSGATEREIAEILGHKDPKVTRRYTHLSPGHTQGVVDLLDFSRKDKKAKNTTEVEVSG